MCQIKVFIKRCTNGELVFAEAQVTNVDFLSTTLIVVHVNEDLVFKCGQNASCPSFVYVEIVMADIWTAISAVTNEMNMIHGAETW